MTCEYKLTLLMTLLHLCYLKISLFNLTEKTPKRELTPLVSWNEKFEVDLLGTYVGKHVKSYKLLNEKFQDRLFRCCIIVII